MPYVLIAIGFAALVNGHPWIALGLVFWAFLIHD